MPFAAASILRVGRRRPVNDQARPPRSRRSTELQTMTARFAPADIGADLSALPAERTPRARQAGRGGAADGRLFLRQVWAGNDAMLQELARRCVAGRRRGRAPSRARLHYFLINKGPWSRLDHNRAFVPARRAKPEAANFYPAGATKADVEQWIDALPATTKARATGFFTTIRRGAPAGRLRRRAVQRRVPGRARARGSAAARGGGS